MNHQIKEVAHNHEVLYTAQTHSAWVHYNSSGRLPMFWVGKGRFMLYNAPERKSAFFLETCPREHQISSNLESKCEAQGNIFWSFGRWPSGASGLKRTHTGGQWLPSGCSYLTEVLLIHLEIMQALIKVH